MTASAGTYLQALRSEQAMLSVSRLTGAAGEATKPGGELLAGRILLAATNVASREFSATATEINGALR